MATRVFYGNAADNSVSSSNASYATARAMTGTLVLAGVTDLFVSVGQNTTFLCHEAFIEFDTNVGLGAITSAVLATAKSSGPTTAFTVQVRLLDWGASVTTADVVAGASLGALTLLATISTTTMTSSLTNFTDVAMAANINKTGFSRFILNSDKQETNTQPTTADIITIASGDNGVTLPIPRLTIVDDTNAFSQTINQGTTTFTPTVTGIHDVELTGGGAKPAASANQEAGAGGAAFSFGRFNVPSLSNITVQVGAGATADNTAGTDSWFNSTADLLAKGGAVLAGGDAAACVGLLKQSGGGAQAAQGGSGSRGGSGGGGAATSGGDGLIGAAGVGSAGGAGGNDGDNATTNKGGNGGNSGVAGVTGSGKGSGGGGGGNGANAGNGADGVIVIHWTTASFTYFDMVQPNQPKVHLKKPPTQIDLLIPPTPPTVILEPASDVIDGNWTNELDSNVNLYQSIDELVPSDVDYIKSETDPVNDTTVIGLDELSSLYTINPGGPFKVRYRYYRSGTAGQVDLTIRLLQGATQIATWTHTNISTGVLQGEQSLTPAQIATLVGAADLRLEFKANKV